MTAEKPCAECGAAFLPESNGAKYCGDECRRASRRRRDAQAHARFRERQRGGLPPAGPSERAVIREHCEPVEVRLTLRDVREMEFLLDLFPDRAFTVLSPARSRKDGDVANYGRKDAACREHGTEKLIVAAGRAGGREIRYEKDRARKVLGDGSRNDDGGKE